MCGVIGICGSQAVNQSVYEGLLALQHRGQDAAGITTLSNKQFNTHKGSGLVRDVFSLTAMQRLTGSWGIGHVRYPTSGTTSHHEAQPFYVNSPFGISLAHNGNLVNSDALAREIYNADRRHINTESDSEVLLNVFAHELANCCSVVPTPAAIFKAVANVQQRCVGAYSVVTLIAGFGLVAFRDPSGIRPLVLGKKSTGPSEWIVASETIALDILDFEFVDDIKPGETVIIDKQHQIHRHTLETKQPFTPCIFEYVYLARPDSVINGVSVYQARLNMGRNIAEKIAAQLVDKVDVVIPIPDTSRVAAQEIAAYLNVPYREGLIKNRYIGRTFIMPSQLARKQSVKQKLNPIKSELEGKNVMLVDDSIVRGTTSCQIVALVRKAGAKKIVFISAAPPITHPNVYGIDMPSREDLIAADKTTEEIGISIGADQLIFQTLEDLEAAVSQCNPAITQFETSVFTGSYAVGSIDQDYLDKIAAARNVSTTT